MVRTNLSLGQFAHILFSTLLPLCRRSLHALIPVITVLLGALPLLRLGLQPCDNYQTLGTADVLPSLVFDYLTCLSEIVQFHHLIPSNSDLACHVSRYEIP